MPRTSRFLAAAALSLAALVDDAALANALRASGTAAQVAGAPLTVTPARDWNKLDIKPGKRTEVWTLDGEQLNDVTFYAGIEPGHPLMRERDKKRAPLPRLSAGMLLAEVPELLERTYRAGRDVPMFAVTSAAPERFLGTDGVRFTYDYTDADNLPRKGEARAVLIGGKLYMATFDAPRLHFFDRSLADFRALANSATLSASS